MEWGENLAAHRHAGMAHKVLFEGDEGSPDNFVLVLARESSAYYSPVHRHPWDQVRLCLEGAVPLGGGLFIEAGEVGYFPEGVTYGPQEGGTDRIVLLLQCGGASGYGYLSAGQLRRARAELANEGAFEHGVFRATSGGEGEDAYEAIWRHVTGRRIEFPQGRYKAPIVMRSAAFAWDDVAGAPGVRRRALGTFSEGAMSVEFYELGPTAAVSLGESTARRFAFACRGEGECDGERYCRETAVRLEPGERATFEASLATELFVITTRLRGQRVLG
jgi:hypothetical protein